MRKFFIGQKVVCIGEFNVKRKYQEQYPVKGKTYTVRGFIEHGGLIGILIEEIVNPKCQYADGHNEAAYDIHNFRPLHHDDSAISEILARFPLSEEKIDAEIKESTEGKK